MKKIILIILMFISVNVFSQTLTTYYSFKTYPTSINKNIYWYGVNFSRIDSVLHLLATGSTSFDLTAFHSFSGINNFTNGTTFSDSVRMTRLSVDTLTITNLKRSIMFFTSLVFSPADATTYYLGGSEANAPENSAGIRRVYFPVACTIKACVISCYKGATAGTTENVESYIRLNNTTDYTIVTNGQWTTANGSDQMTNTSMTVPIAAGDYIEFKIVCPTWSTNPLNTRVSATISIE